MFCSVNVDLSVIIDFGPKGVGFFVLTRGEVSKVSNQRERM